MTAVQIFGTSKVVYFLRQTFSSYGYSEYKMNKFEEYDLYVKNKDFLISDNVITFTDTNGKLLALKPDVTLSIVKNTKDGQGINKVFYSENVYRVSSKSNGYREIPQMGLECIGDIDGVMEAEVISLAKQSLNAIDKNNVLELSPVGIVLDYIDRLSLTIDVKKTAYKFINEKNVHELTALLNKNGVDDERVIVLCELVTLCGKAKTVLSKLEGILKNTPQEKLLRDFESVIIALDDQTLDGIIIDCSAVKNVKYYNDVTFRGYIEGLPKEVLSGGRYDGLLKTMGKKSGAIGFAIYLDEFDRLFATTKDYDLDVIVLYDDNSDKKLVLKKVKELVQENKTVSALKSVPNGITYKEIIKI